MPRFALGVVILLLCAFVVSCKSTPTSYESSNLKNSSAQKESADKYWKVDGWGKINPAGARSAAVVEFNVEYMTSESANMQRFGTAMVIAERFGAFKKTYEYEEQFMDSFTLELYDQFVKQMKATGFNVVPRETLQADAEFEKIKGAEKDRSTRQQSRLEKKTGIIVNAPGFPRQDAGFFGANAIANARALPQLSHNVGADIAISVFVRLGLTKDGKPVIAQGSVIRVYSDLKEYKMPGGIQYGFEKNVSMKSKQGMFAGTTTTTRAGSAFGKGKIIKVDSASFRQGVMTMYPAYMRMASEKLK